MIRQSHPITAPYIGQPLPALKDGQALGAITVTGSGAKTDVTVAEAGIAALAPA
ncbi:hypothetical protein OG568_54510 (plasmid) [Streptomyces sp. NBC_01450]|uniref:hypothetical protein n=1 Tax=Streptomyces sp. NBC_01450 TaxID=2903871 RepID=UPI002E34EED6|nr:hypothetical protein [Streptomyces sp. NBC_01450]